MEIVELILSKFDPITLAVLVTFYFKIWRKLNILDNAVNNRKDGEATISDEVSEISTKLDTVTEKQIENETTIKYTKEQVDLHRSVDEKAFLRIEKDIRAINVKLAG